MSETTEKKTTNHLMHAVLSVVTGGLWLPVWLAAYIGGSTRTFTVVRVVVLGVLVVVLK